MHSRTALPLLLLFASACAELPDTAPNLLDTSVPAATAAAQSAAPGPSAQPAAPAASPRTAAPRPSAPPLVVTAPAPAVAAVATAAPVEAPATTTTPAPRVRVIVRPSRTEQAAARTLATKTAEAAEAAEAAAPSKSLWDRISRGFAMAPFESDLVRDWENWYANRPDYVARMIDRSSHFLFHIVEQVEKRGMPMEIALLPMIESAYNPVAYSRSHASGIWQFIPSTGKDFGLRQSWWYDGRRDVIAATDAALDYLEKLYGMFGDWQLALASYNWGEGAVSRAIERNRAKGLPTDYENLTMPPETRGYIPKLVAVKNIILNPARYGLAIADIPNEPYFETVTVKRHIDVKLAAKFAEMPLEEFRFLNPGHNKPVIRAGEAERIVLPKHTVAMFRANLAGHDRPLVSWEAVTLRHGQKAERLAAERGITLNELKQLNGLQHQKRLVAGQPLLVPLKNGAEPQLPDIPVKPLSLPKAMQAAKAAANARKGVQATGRTPKTILHKPTTRAAAQKVRKPPVQPLRAENGKRVKVVITKPAPAKKAAPNKERVASR